MRKALIALVSLLVGTALVVPTGGEAQAADGDCAVAVALPKKVKIASSWTSFAVTVSQAPSDCVSFAQWDLVRSDGANVGSLLFSNPGPQTLREDLHVSDGPGMYRAYGNWGFDKNYYDLRIYDSGGQMQAKFASKISLKVSTKPGKKLVFKGKVTKFGSTGDWHGWNANVQLQRKVKGKWKTVKIVRAKKDGKYEIVLGKKKRSYWRTTVKAGPVVWDAASRIQRK